jgi:hypothetical protein
MNSRAETDHVFDAVERALTKIGRPATASEIYEADNFTDIQSLYVWLGNEAKKPAARICRQKPEGGGKFVYSLTVKATTHEDAFGDYLMDLHGPNKEARGSTAVRVMADKHGEVIDVSPLERAQLRADVTPTPSQLDIALGECERMRDELNVKCAKLTAVIVALKELLG